MNYIISSYGREIVTKIFILPYLSLIQQSVWAKCHRLELKREYMKIYGHFLCLVSKYLRNVFINNKKYSEEVIIKTHVRYKD